MKQIKYIGALSLITLALGLSSCDKFLDVTPVGKVIPTTTQDYREVLNQLYNTRISDKGYTDLRTDIAVLRDNADDRTSMEDIELWVDATPRSSTREWSWARFYTAIYYANAVIKAESKMSGGTQNERKQLIGEAYMLRAILNFTLVNLYGQPYTKEGAINTLAVPLKLDTDIEGTLVRSTVGDAYKSVLSDIAAARELINEDKFPLTQSYRFNKASVDALAARVYLYQGDWSDALAASEKVLATQANLVDLRNNAVLPNLYNSGEVFNAYELNVDNNLSRAMRAPSAFYNSFQSGDLRKALFFGNKVDKQDYYEIKKADGTNVTCNSFRTAEFYLTSAEAAARLGNLATARQRILQLLEKRYDEATYATLTTQVNALSQDALVSFILEERKKELCYEGHIWFDLRRTTRPALTKKTRSGEYKLSQDDPRYTLRIPKEAISRNGNLTYTLTF